jgi:prophage regulatory protein
VASALIRLPVVMSRTGISRSTLYALIKDGRFPKPVKIGARMSAWVETEINQWIEDVTRSRGH